MNFKTVKEAEVDNLITVQIESDYFIYSRTVFQKHYLFKLKQRYKSIYCGQKIKFISNTILLNNMTKIQIYSSVNNKLHSYDKYFFGYRSPLRKGIVFDHNQRSALNVFHSTTVLKIRDIGNKITKITFELLYSHSARAPCFNQLVFLNNYNLVKYVACLHSIAKLLVFHNCSVIAVHVWVLTQASAIVCRLRSGVPK